MTGSKPRGRPDDHLIAIVSQYPRDFSGLGLKVSDGFGQTTVARRARRPRSTGNRAVDLRRQGVCEQPCTDEYGAALFTVEEIK